MVSRRRPGRPRNGLLVTTRGQLGAALRGGDPCSVILVNVAAEVSTGARSSSIQEMSVTYPSLSAHEPLGDFVDLFW
jgi:hypothetical protein